MVGQQAAAPAARLLAAVRDVYAEAGTPLPARMYVAPGPTAAWDGEHVAVSLTGTRPGSAASMSRSGSPPARGAGTMTMPTGTYEARVLRCIPVVADDGTPPAPDAITAASEGLLADAGLLLDAGYRFTANCPPGAVASVEQLTPLGPEGGLAGYSTAIVVCPLA